MLTEQNKKMTSEKNLRIQGLTSSTISDSDIITGPVQIVQKKRIVTGQNNIPMNGERYLIQ